MQIVETDLPELLEEKRLIVKALIPLCERTNYHLHPAKIAAGFPRVYLFRPAYIYPVEPRREPTLSYRLLRVVYPVFKFLFPNQVIPADELARTMVAVAVREASERGSIVLENRDIRAMVGSL